MKSYHDFISSKAIRTQEAGFEPSEMCPALFRYQREAVAWAVRQGRAALFLDTGLGKTICQLEWARQCARHTGKPSLVLAPLAVADQTVREGKRFGIDTVHAREASDIDGASIYVTNYHRLDRFDASIFGAVVLDESSILKSFVGSTKRMLCDSFKATPYRLACTATPAPNDYMELGNHSEFLGVMPSNEMLSRWFVVDSMDMGKYRVKGHAVEQFWAWVSSWAVCAMNPGDLGHPEEDFQLPPMEIVERHINVDARPEDTGSLFNDMAVSATDLAKVRRSTLANRVEAAAEIANAADGPVVVWCQTNDESSMLAAAIPDAVEVVGSESPEVKEEKLLAFQHGKARVIVTKPSIAGFGLNWQHCNTVVFSSINYSYEQFYQAVRRCWRFGQERKVIVHMVLSDMETGVIDAIMRKKGDHEMMKTIMKSANFKSREGIVAQLKRKYDGGKEPKVPTFLGVRT